MGAVPALWIQPRDFSSSVVIPPALFPGVGFPCLGFSPTSLKDSSKPDIMARRLSPSSFVLQRFAKRCSAPIISGVSDKITVPPRAVRLSPHIPTSGFAASPEVGSDPPHSVPRISSAASACTRFCFSASFTIFSAAAAAFSTVFRLPPSSRIIKYSSGLLVLLRISFSKSAAWITSQPFPISIVPYTLGLAAIPDKVSIVIS